MATVIDSQSIKAAETVGKDSCGYDAGKKFNGRKRHLVVDTKGLPLFVMVTPADMTDRNAAKEMLFRLRLMHPEIAIVWADSAYAGQLVTWAKTYLNLTIKTVSRPKDASGFVILPRRWVVERSHCQEHARPSACSRLRTARPALGSAHHLGRDHHHDQANHPAILPQKQSAGRPRGRAGLIILKVRTTTLALPGRNRGPELHSPAANDSVTRTA